MRMVLIVLLSVGLTGCFLGKKKIVAVLPQPPQPALTKPAPVLSIPPSVTPIETPAAETPAPVAKAEEIQPAPVAAAPVETKKVTPRRARHIPPPSPVVPEIVASEPVPQLREILSPERRAQYESEFSASVTRATSAMSQTARRKLNGTQRENVSRIQMFLSQAETARKDDLGTALQLARRADLLAQDLLKSLLP